MEMMNKERRQRVTPRAGRPTARSAPRHTLGNSAVSGEQSDGLTLAGASTVGLLAAAGPAGVIEER